MPPTPSGLAVLVALTLVGRCRPRSYYTANVEKSCVALERDLRAVGREGRCEVVALAERELLRSLPSASTSERIAGSQQWLTNTIRDRRATSRARSPQTLRVIRWMSDPSASIT
jgi:hypothetical protein